MKAKNILNKIAMYVTLNGTGVIGLYVASRIQKNILVTQGILGLAVLYYSYRLHFYPLKTKKNDDNEPLEFKFPIFIKYIIYAFGISVVIFLAFSQIFTMVFWLIKKIR
jgi:hypothetical protein